MSKKAVVTLMKMNKLCKRRDFRAEMEIKNCPD
jgi:hypothetical protein